MGACDEMAAPRPVLVAGGSPAGVPAGLVAGLAGRAEAVVAVDRGLDVLLEAGVTPDLFCGDADSVGAAGAAAVRAAEEAAAGGVPAFAVERYDPHKDFTDLSLALRAVRARWGSVPLLCCGLAGGRPDHFLGVLGRLAAWQGGVELWEDGYRGRILHPGESWRLEQAQGRRFSFVPLTPGARVSLTGFRWNLDAVAVEPLSDLGISNVVEDSPALISCQGGTVGAWCFD